VRDHLLPRILLVFLNWPTTGVLVEMFGFLNLFGCVAVIALLRMCYQPVKPSFDFFPVDLPFLRQLPFIVQFLNLPYVRHFVDHFAGSRISVV